MWDGLFPDGVEGFIGRAGCALLSHRMSRCREKAVCAMQRKCARAARGPSEGTPAALLARDLRAAHASTCAFLRLKSETPHRRLHETRSKSSVFLRISGMVSHANLFIEQEPDYFCHQAFLCHHGDSFHFRSCRAQLCHSLGSMLPARYLILRAWTLP